jgi:hypothetical protein
MIFVRVSNGTTTVRTPLDSDDTAGFTEGLAALG